MPTTLAKLRHNLEEVPYIWACIGSAILLLISAIAWWFLVYLGPKHVFWTMIQNSLNTDSVVIKTEQYAGKDSLKQLVHVDTAQADMARSLTTLKQQGTEVKTEIIGTPKADYTRYLEITSPSKEDVSTVKNVWSKSADTKQSQTQVSGHQLYAQATLGVGLPLGSVPVPIGSLTSKQRSVLYNYIRSERVYSPDFSKVKRERKNGRLLYTYDVKLQAILYVRMMQAFAKDLGLSELDSANPNAYQNNPTITVSVTVDALSHQLASVNFKELGYSQHYESYGLPLKVTLPKKAISSDELQNRLKQLSQTQ